MLDLAACRTRRKSWRSTTRSDAWSRTSPLAAAVVRLRFYAGLTVAEAAEALGVSERTVDREWAYARAWLFRLLDGDGR